MSDSLGLAVLSRVPEADRSRFVQALSHLAAVDDDVSVEEKEMLAGVAEAWDLDDGETSSFRTALQEPPSAGLEEHVEAFTESYTPFLLLQELVRLSLADGTYARVEQDAVRTVADRLGFASEVLEEIEVWVERGTVWRGAQGGESSADALSDILNREEDTGEYDLSDIPTTGSQQLDDLNPGADGEEDDDRE
jgi:uncharacterized tellurite resistance protein B-like protein